MNRTIVRTHPKLTAPEFGVMENFYQEHIQGRDLSVLSYHQGFYQVEVLGEPYTLHESDTETNNLTS